MNARGIVAAFALLITLPSFAGTQTRTSAFEYDPTSGQLIREVIEPDNSALCLVSTYTYDAYGNRTGATTRNCNGTSSGGLTEAAAPTGDPVFTARSSSSAFAAGSVAINGIIYNWSAGEFATSNANALNQSESRTFDPRFGGTASLTGPNGITTSWTYDSFGRKSSESRADSTVTNWSYTRCVDSPGTCPATGVTAYAVYFVTVTATGAPTTVTYYDSLNREVRSQTQGFDGTPIYKDTQYDSLGRVAQVSRPYYSNASPVWTVFGYDILSRVVQVDEPSTPSGGNTGQMHTVTAYNNAVTTTTWTTTVTVSNAGTGTDMPAGVVQTKATTKNSQGQVIKVADTQGNTVSYTYAYDTSGNLTTTTTDALGNVTTVINDRRGRKTSMADPDMGAWAYFYDALGQLIRQTDAKNQTSIMVYDVVGRVTNRTEPDLVSTWTYDSCTKGIGKLCQASATNSYSRTYTYDSLGRPFTLAASIDTSYTVTTTYDSAGRPNTVTYPTGFAVQKIYNPYGYLWKVQRADAGGSTVFWTVNAEDASGRVTSEFLANGLTQTRGYDAMDRLTSVVASGTAGTVHNFGYTYDTIGNVLTRADNVDAITESFAFDNLNRLLAASGPGLVTRSFNYDALGNMTYKSDVGTYTYPTPGAGSVRPHAVSSVSGTVNSSYAYDPNGNLLSGSGRTVTPTSFNMPATIVGSAATYTYTYNPEHERVKLVATLSTGTHTIVYLHPGGAGSLFYEKEIHLDGTVENKHYVQAGSILVGVYVTKSAYASGDGPQMRYYHRDSLGSIMAITNDSAAVIERLAYEAFGHRRYTNGTADSSCSIFGITTERGFTAHEHLDELCLIHMNGRVYDPTLARFMTPDPFIQSPDNLQSYNRYSYVVNNPLGYTDPTGYHHWKKQIAHITRNIMKVAGSNKYLGGLIQMGLLTYPGLLGNVPFLNFGTAYGWSTGDWKTVGRAYATEAVMAATIWAGGAAWAAYNGTFEAGVLFVEESAAIGYASSYATAYVNGASAGDAQSAALLSAKRAAGFAVVQIGARALAEAGLEKDKNDPNVKKMTSAEKEQVENPHAYKAPGEPNFVGQQINKAGEINKTWVGAYGPIGSWISDHIPFGNYAGLVTDGWDTHPDTFLKWVGWGLTLVPGVATAYGAVWGQVSAASSAGQQFHRTDPTEPQ